MSDKPEVLIVNNDEVRQLIVTNGVDGEPVVIGPGGVKGIHACGPGTTTIRLRQALFVDEAHLYPTKETP